MYVILIMLHSHMANVMEDVWVLLYSTVLIKLDTHVHVSRWALLVSK